MDAEADLDEDAYPCPEEWPSRSLLCKPHRCDLIEGHEGKHVCNCGMTRRTE